MREARQHQSGTLATPHSCESGELPARMAQIHRGSSLLELEAAHYFKLDPNQLDLCPIQSNGSSARGAESLSAHTLASDFLPSHACHRIGDHHHRHHSQHRHHRRRHHPHHQRHHQYHRTSDRMGRSNNGADQTSNLSREFRSKATRVGSSLQKHETAKLSTNGKRSNVKSQPQQPKSLDRSRKISSQLEARDQAQDGGPPKFKPISPRKENRSPERRAPSRQLGLEPTTFNGSSTTSTNSLPSISSSPSVSPSIVCPHLSLDDLLETPHGSRGVSPHTIGLCSRCRLDPPPNVHSPLSPMFKPYAYDRNRARQAKGDNKMNKSTGDLRPAGQTRQVPPKTRQELRRGQSDHAAGRYATRRSLSNLSGKVSNMRDDSLDFGLGLNELRRLQMSPTLRHSVEFIRKNSIESGRVLKIYKNGEPYEKPLRVCIMRGEFANINHFLDHINTRLLVPLGARYLFHLDGQLVYSVEELKHGSTYVVSGTRCFDYRASHQLKEQNKKEEQQKMSRYAPVSRELAPKIDSNSVTRAEDQIQQQYDSTIRLDQIATSSPRPKNPQFQFRQQIAPRKINERHDQHAAGVSKQQKSSEAPVRLARAKSELSALPKKQKKNVTFMDTGRGSSPAISDNRVPMDSELDGNNSESELDEEPHTSRWPDNKNPTARGKQLGQPVAQPKVAAAKRTDVSLNQANDTSKLKEFSTTDVGIQVSDTIDGFLIDLPVALPARGDDSNLRSRPPMARRGPGAAGKTSRTPAAGGDRKRQIVTITERQLSLEEMNGLNDLSQGDHHHEPIMGQDDFAETKSLSDASGQTEPEASSDEPEVIPDRSNTIAIGSDPQVDTGTQTVTTKINGASRLVSSSQAPNGQKGKRDSTTGGHWQYPGGRAASVTPTERPVSQSGPNETVRARVTTPTPSLSTVGGGDENSLSVSYENISPADGQPVAVARQRRAPMKLPAKRKTEVTGLMHSGLHEPQRNFRLVWVNGFSINDLYPENSVSEQQLLELKQRNEVAGSLTPLEGAKHLSPEHSRRRTPTSQSEGGQVPAFKPSERYHNWICHSRRHNELVFPAGSLIVLWCQWTNEQRFYAKHTSNVSAVALATLDLDLAASGQVCELYERPQISANVHLWSISNLDTLMIIEDDQLRTKLIFSLRVKNAKTSGCELSVGARDEKQLLLFTFNRKFVQQQDAYVEPNEDHLSPQKKLTDVSKRRSSAGQSELNLRVNKVIQSNQVPLFIMKVPNATSEFKANSKQQPAETKCEPIICFGRRCFQIWSPDVRQQKLRLLQADGKSTKFASLVVKANCLCRLSPSELLVGDSDGNVALLATNLYTSNSIGDAPRRMPTKANPAWEARDLKYGVETMPLLGPLADGNNGTRLASNLGARQPVGITCLARITGSLFMSADTACALRFWKIEQQANKFPVSSETSIPTIKLSSDISSKGSGKIQCEQLASISLPSDLGFICTILLANYNRVDSVVEFYVVSTCNTILFGSVKLQLLSGKQNSQQELLANSSLSVVYEGHETSASNLVADFKVSTRAQMILNKQASDHFYFTCSLDCRICKWNGRQLVWKSMLPSSCVSLAVHPNGFVLAVGSIDGTVYILDKISGLLISYFPLTPVRINCLAYSSDGTLLAAGCANGSIFILPVYERGLKYKKVSIFQSPNAVVSLQFSVNNRYMLTSVTHGSFQELILWDLPNFRYMRDNVKLVADKIKWFDPICTGSEDVRAIWENDNLAATQDGAGVKRAAGKRSTSLSASTAGNVKRIELQRDGFVINLSCHRLVRDQQQPGEVEPKEGNYVIASDTRGYLRLFRYPSYDIQQGFYGVRISSSAVNCCRFLNSEAAATNNNPDYFVSTSLDGSICLWALE